jgi:hypothetical protein
MTSGLERIVTLTFGKDGNDANHLGIGWSGEEAGFRWMVGQASDLWVEHPGAGHDLILELDTDIIVGSGGSTTQGTAHRLVIGVRNTGIAQIVVPRGGVLGFHIPAALVATPGPVRILFVHPDFRRPMDIHGGSDDRQLSFSARQVRLSRILSRPRMAAAPPLPPEQMISRFESLGDNCEFGLAQRRLGVEPLGLLRFSFIELPQLLRGLRRGFEGLGDPDRTTVTVDSKDGEFIVREAAYGITYHTFQFEHQMSLDAVRAQQGARLNFLKRKLMEDAANGEKIFVIKRAHPLRPEEVLPLYAILNELGWNWLLWVVPADQTHPSGTVEVLLPGLLRGYVDRFAPNDNAPDLSLPAWVAVCEAAWRAVGQPVRG